ncbi:hypothetical protein H8K90_04960 [Winogradskyella echinorum]|uniref:ABC-2 type transport system permease protein n=1 Tax=Winogradskyella echinorum TaxID=538189 RepID=A0ABR6XZ06_9FLAO|nr:DUF5687 family protein [Winogradskyella echinorum]MBC3845717.1 hypothetical protein [Winogradskyella echinorum]MBC5750065.1 hypothetical protein [Winogradskyella echinorum]
MIKHFINLEWKQYFRSSYWQKSIAINILMVFFALYFVGMFLFLGAFLFKILGNLVPDQDPFTVVNNFIFYWIIGDLLMRFFLQKLPVMSVKPLLTLPIKRSTVVNYVLGKSALSFFNFLPLFAIIPFSISLLSNGYDTSMVLTWMFTMILIVLIINFINFIIEAFSAETELSFLPVIAVVGVLYGLDYFNILPMRSLVGDGLLSIANKPILILIPIAVLLLCYIYNYKILKGKLFLDSSLKSKVTEVKAADLSWTNRFGDIAPFMQLDLKLIWRNKRTKSMAMLLLIGLLYGLFFYPQPMYRDMEFMFAFIGVFSTGFFLINFGQFIPAWDSGYYKMLMSQNIKYEQYLRSKFILMIMSVAILFILGIPYVYFGWKILIAHFAAAIYNIGVNSHVILYGGSFNRKKIDLDKKAAFNYQGTGAVQWLIGIPLMVLPMALFGLTNWLVGFEAAVALLIVLGVTGIVLHKKLMTLITKKYLDSKYKMIDAFSQDN